MALYTQSQFAEICGVDKAKVSVYKKRGKIILSGDLIDDTIEQNAYILKKWKAESELKKQVKDEEYTEEKPSKSSQEVSKKKKFSSSPKVPKFSEPTSTDYLSLNKEKMAREIARLDEQIEILRVQKEKLHGQVIPTDLVKSVFKQHTASIVTAFKNGVENLLIELSKVKDFSRAELAELRGKMTQVINNSSEDSIKMSKSMIASILAQYSSDKAKNK